MGERTATGFFLAPVGASSECDEDRTIVDAPRHGEVSLLGARGERTVFTAEMLETLRDRLREAEAREASGVRVRLSAEERGALGLDDDLGEVEDAVDDTCALQRLEEALGRVPELEVGLAPNSESNLYAGFDTEHPDGVFIATYASLPIGTPVYVTVHLPGGYRFRTPALVAWARLSEAASPGAPAGLGLAMCGLDPAMRQLVSRFARHRAPIFYVDGRGR